MLIIGKRLVTLHGVHELGQASKPLECRRLLALLQLVDVNGPGSSRKTVVASSKETAILRTVMSMAKQLPESGQVRKTVKRPLLNNCNNFS